MSFLNTIMFLLENARPKILQTKVKRRVTSSVDSGDKTDIYLMGFIQSLSSIKSAESGSV